MDLEEGDYTIWKFDTLREEWSEKEIDETIEGYDIVPRDSQAYWYADGYYYMHGGYSDYGLSNSLVRIDLTQSIAKWEIVNYD